MRTRHSDPNANTGHKGGNLIPALCNVLGTLLILAVIVTCLPLTVPRLFGLEIYGVVSGSMEPTIPVGSVIYVRPVVAREVEAGDVIAFTRGDDVVTHRVVENRKIEGAFVTKGDANDMADPATVPYEALIGRVERHFPAVGRFMLIYASGMGKLYALAVALSGLMLNILAGQIRDRRAEKRRLRELEAEILERMEQKKDPDR